MLAKKKTTLGEVTKGGFLSSDISFCPMYYALFVPKHVEGPAERQFQIEINFSRQLQTEG